MQHGGVHHAPQVGGPFGTTYAMLEASVQADAFFFEGDGQPSQQDAQGNALRNGQLDSAMSNPEALRALSDLMRERTRPSRMRSPRNPCAL